MSKVFRHNAIVRTTHWIVALSGMGLIFSGMGELPMYKRYNITKIPGLEWSSDFILQLKIHYVFAAIFGATLVFHAIYHSLRKEFSALPQKGDVKESWLIIKAMLTGGEEPPSEKFLAEQRLAYLAIAITSLGLLVTGLIKTYKNIYAVVLDPTFLQVVTLLHTGLTMVFALLVAMHVGAFALKANRPLLPSMFTGMVDKGYAEERHPRWKK